MKLLVVGWDGADWRHLQQFRPSVWVDLRSKGKLFSEDAFRGIYIDSGNAWTTITTGVSVEYHGIDSLLSVNQRPDMYSRLLKLLRQKWLRGFIKSLSTARTCHFGERAVKYVLRRTAGPLQPQSIHVKYKRIWDYIDEKSLIFCVPITYPPQKVNGILISGIPHPKGSQGLGKRIYPDKYATVLEAKFPGFYYLPPECIPPFQPGGEVNLATYKRNVFKVHDTAIETIKMFYQFDDFELVFAVLPVIDNTLHASSNVDEVATAYAKINDATIQLIDFMKPDNVLILSDHGMKKWNHPRLKMNHDSENGIWASNVDFALENHLDVCPAILKLFGKAYRSETKDVESTESNQKEEEALRSHLASLGYL